MEKQLIFPFWENRFLFCKLKLEHVSEPPGELLKMVIAGPHLEFLTQDLE